MTDREKVIEKLREAGRKGGIATREKRGSAHFRKIGSKGGKSRWQKLNDLTQKKV